MSSPREIFFFLRPECLRSGADHNSAEIPGRGQARGPVNVILHWTYKKKKKGKKNFKKKGVRMRGNGLGGWGGGG